MRAFSHPNWLFLRRGSHYPQDPRFLDRCDERGVLVWEEALAWGNPAKTLTAPAFLKASVATANAMLERDRNHPSILFWAFFNEVRASGLSSSCGTAGSPPTHHYN